MKQICKIQGFSSSTYMEIMIYNFLNIIIVGKNASLMSLQQLVKSKDTILNCNFQKQVFNETLKCKGFCNRF